MNKPFVYNTDFTTSLKLHFYKYDLVSDIILVNIFIVIVFC